LITSQLKLSSYQFGHYGNYNCTFVAGQGSLLIHTLLYIGLKN